MDSVAQEALISLASLPVPARQVQALSTVRRTHKGTVVLTDAVCSPWTHLGGVSGSLRDQRQHQQNLLLRAAGTLITLVGCPGAPK